MGDTTQIQIDAENAEQFLEEALKAEESAKGETPADDEADETTEETPDETQDTKADEKAEGGLEIGQKKDEDASAEEGGDDAETFDMESVYNEWAQNGELSEDTNNALVDRLEKAGFPNAQGIIDQYLAGAQASVAAVRSTAFNAAGGQEQYTAMTDWARDNLSAQQIAAYDAAVSNPDMVELAVRGLRAQYEAAGGEVKQQTAKKVGAGAKPDGDFSGTVPLPRSNYQISELVSDARYAKDPGYRAEVDARIQQALDRGLIK